MMMDAVEILGVVNLMKCCAQTAMAVPMANANAILRQQGWEETVMPMLDPTQFRNHMGDIEKNRRFVEAFVRFRADLESLKEDAGAR
jgi:hypothetical protein